eukprot:scaffold187620_cov27-Tisochrysis_lutea.AAC.1
MMLYRIIEDPHIALCANPLGAALMYGAVITQRYIALNSVGNATYRALRQSPDIRHTIPVLGVSRFN